MASKLKAMVGRCNQQPLSMISRHDIKAKSYLKVDATSKLEAWQASRHAWHLRPWRSQLYSNLVIKYIIISSGQNRTHNVHLCMQRFPWPLPLQQRERCVTLHLESLATQAHQTRRPPSLLSVGGDHSEGISRQIWSSICLSIGPATESNIQEREWLKLTSKKMCSARETFN